VCALILVESRAGLQTRRMTSGYVRNAIFYGLVGVLNVCFGTYQIR
jgi:hypothetical protein